MKKEVAFFKDKRYKPTAANLIKLYRFLGYTDEQIIAEMKKIKAARRKTQVQDMLDNGELEEVARIDAE